MNSTHLDCATRSNTDAPKVNGTPKGQAARKYRVTSAERVELALRGSSLEMAGRLDSVRANCNFALANSDNKQVREFAQIILTLIKKP